MKRFKHIIEEVKQLEKYEVHKDLIHYLNTEFGLHTDINIFMNYIDIYTSELRDSNTDITDIKEDKVSKALKTFFNKQNYNRKAEATWLTPFGYTIVLENDADVFENKVKEENTLYFYYNHDEFTDTNVVKNVMAYNTTKDTLTENKHDTSDLNKEIDDIEDNDTTNDTTNDTSIDHKDVSKDTSNIILDTKFVWFFNVLDENETTIIEDVMELEEAIDILIDNDGAMIVGMPYVDPDESNDDVDLIFAENPGVVIVYDGR